MAYLSHYPSIYMGWLREIKKKLKIPTNSKALTANFVLFSEKRVPSE